MIRHKSTKRSFLTRLTNRFQRSSNRLKRDQSIQTSFSTDRHRTELSDGSNGFNPKRQRRSSLKTFLIPSSTKSFSLIRRSLNLQNTNTGRISSNCLHVALIRKIPRVHRSKSFLDSVPMQISSLDKRVHTDDVSFIEPMTWSTPNQSRLYRTSSPNEPLNYHEQSPLFHQLSFSNIFDFSE